MLQTLAIENYRSLRNVALPLAKLTVITGANGSGKSSLYRALRLLGETSNNRVVGALAREGGLKSTLWAGTQVRRRDDRTGLRLGIATTEIGYAIDLGVPGGLSEKDDYERGSMFTLDPHIKCESLWAGPVLRPATAMVERINGSVRVRDSDGRWSSKTYTLHPFDSVLSEFADPDVAPELFRVRERVRSWRFYDHFRTDPLAPVRAGAVGTHTPALAADGHDLAAAMRTIYEIGDRHSLAETVGAAFPGSSVDVVEHNGYFDLLLDQPGMRRPLAAGELSDGTLRYLMLVAALLTPRPPELIVLNEPETSLHPDLLAPLGCLIATAANNSQLIVVSHARPLVAAIEHAAEEFGADTCVYELAKNDGETVFAGMGLLDRPAWHWPRR